MSASRKVSVFSSHGCTTNLHHVLIDSVMPRISGNAWKLLCLIARQTDGWNREEIGLSYRDLIAGMGVSSRATVAAAIKELEPLNLLVLKVGRSQWEETTYSLNLDAEAEWQPRNFGQPSVTKNVTGSHLGPVTKTGTRVPVTEIVPVPETVTATVPNSVTASVTESVPFNRKETNKKQRKQFTAPPLAKPAREGDQLVRIFDEAFIKANDCPYASKKADFVQLSVLKKTYAGKSWELDDSRFTRAVSNYFASDLGQFTLADLCVRFGAFYKSPLDRFGKPVQIQRDGIVKGQAANSSAGRYCGRCNHGLLPPPLGESEAQRCACVTRMEVAA